jgi:large conductance mechanosensitive channel
MNTAKKRFEKEQEEKPAEPPKPSAEVVLLTEIRDALANRS